MAKGSRDVIIGFCLDETGSMGSCVEETISGFNEYIGDLKKQEGKTTITLMKFSDVAASEPTHRMFCENAPVEDVPELSHENYVPRGQTPLFDAIGHTLVKVKEGLKATKDLPKEQQPQPIVVIQTDGQENASREYTRQMIFDMIRKREKQGWLFIYLGADQDAYVAERVAVAMGLQADSSMAYGAQGPTGPMGIASAAGSVSAVRDMREKGIAVASPGFASMTKSEYKNRTGIDPDEHKKEKKASSTPKK